MLHPCSSSRFISNKFEAEHNAGQGGRLVRAGVENVLEKQLHNCHSVNGLRDDIRANSANEQRDEIRPNSVNGQRDEIRVNSVNGQRDEIRVNSVNGQRYENKSKLC